MIVAADVSAVSKPWSYQANIDQLVYTTYNEVMTDTVSGHCLCLSHDIGSFNCLRQSFAETKDWGQTTRRVQVNQSHRRTLMLTPWCHGWRHRWYIRILLFMNKRKSDFAFIKT